MPNDALLPTDKHVFFSIIRCLEYTNFCYTERLHETINNNSEKNDQKRLFQKSVMPPSHCPVQCPVQSAGGTAGTYSVDG